jgi:hypothetical protein
MKQEDEISRELRRELEGVVRKIVRDSLAEPTDEASKAYVENAVGEIYASSRWPSYEVDAALERVIREEQHLHKHKVRSDIAWFVLMGFFLWTGFVVVVHGIGQIGELRFWAYFAIGFLPVNTAAYCILALAYKVLLFVTTRQRSQFWLPAGLGCVLPVIYLGVSMLLNRAVYSWIMGR